MLLFYKMNNNISMKYYIIYINLCSCVNVLGTGCVTFKFEDQQLNGCKGKELEGKGIFVSYDSWKINFYILNKTITPFHKLSKNYISPPEPYKGCCSSFKLMMLYGSRIYINVYMSKFPNALMYVKIFEVGNQERNVVDWSNIKNIGWKELEWSTIVISLPKIKLLKSSYYSIAVVGFVRETGVLMIDSIQYVSSKFKGECSVYTDDGNETKLAKYNKYFTNSKINAVTVSVHKEKRNFTVRGGGRRTNSDNVVNDVANKQQVTSSDTNTDATTVDTKNSSNKTDSKDQTNGGKAASYFYSALALVVLVTLASAILVPYCYSNKFASYLKDIFVKPSCKPCLEENKINRVGERKNKKGDKKASKKDNEINEPTFHTQL